MRNMHDVLRYFTFRCSLSPIRIAYELVHFCSLLSIRWNRHKHFRSITTITIDSCRENTQHKEIVSTNFSHLFYFHCLLNEFKNELLDACLEWVDVCICLCVKLYPIDSVSSAERQAPSDEHRTPNKWEILFVQKNEMNWEKAKQIINITYIY